MLKALEVTREAATAGATAVTVFRVQGYLDAHTAPRFEEALRQAVEEGPLHVVVECSLLDYISSAGLGVLIDAHRTLKPKGGDIRVAGMSPAIAEIFDILGFSKVIPTCPSLADALRGLEAPSGEAPT